MNAPPSRRATSSNRSARTIAEGWSPATPAARYAIDSITKEFTAATLLLLGEQFTVGMGIGFPLILIGSVLAARLGRPAGAAAGADAGSADDVLAEARG